MSVIRTPDYRLRVFISSTMGELAAERRVVRESVRRLRLAPVLFEAGARAHPPRALYRSYLEQSHVFLGIYWQRYGWVAPGESVSGLEDEYLLSGSMPKLIYVKHPAPEREGRLSELLDRIRSDDQVSYQRFGDLDELAELVENDLAVLLTERYESARTTAPPTVPPDPDPDTPAPVVVADSIPVPPTPLVGREQEVAGVVELLQRPGVRLVTLTGTGGVGKTRVALAAARRLQADLPAVTWVPFAQTTEPRLVESAIASALGISELPNQRTIELIADQLGDSQHLLVLDNFEQVLPARVTISALLTACPGLKVLVSSRALLSLRGEHDVEILPLPVSTDAVRLFEARAQAVNPSFALDDANRPVVTEICRVLEGLPLAIELAAARTRLLAPQALLERLGDRLSLLTGGSRDLPARQQTLRATLDWDYDLLDDDERALFRRLSVFAGGFTFDAAEAVAAPDPEPGGNLLEAVASLVDKSLLHQQAGPSGAPRLAMLETVREYAGELLASSGEADTVFARHASHYLALARSASLRGADQVQWLTTLEDEHRNFRVALDRAQQSGDLETELRLCAALAPFWELHGHLREGGHRLSAVLARSTECHDLARGQVAFGAAAFARAGGEYDRAETLLLETLDIATAIGDDWLAAMALKDIGIVYWEVDDLDTFGRLSTAALDQFEELGDEVGVARTLNNLGLAAARQGSYEQALAYYRRCITMVRRRGDEVLSARVLQNLGNTLMELGEFETALAVLTRALVRIRALGSTWDVVDCMEFLAAAIVAAGRPGPAAESYAAAERLRQQLGAPRPPYFEAVHQERLERLRHELGESAFRAAWERGTQLSDADALEQALCQADEPRLLDLDDQGIELDLVQRVPEPQATRLAVRSS